MHYLGEMANDVDGLEAAVREALEHPSDGPDAQPTLLVLRSHIGWPSPHLTDTAKAHGDPFGERRDPGDQGDPRAPAGRRRSGSPTRSASSTAHRSPAARRSGAAWAERFEAWDGDRAAWDAAQAGHGLPGWADGLPGFEAGTKLATRHAINQCIDATAAACPASWPARPT